MLFHEMIYTHTHTQACTCTYTHTDTHIICVGGVGAGLLFHTQIC
uniref:Uncharacterized protein n=1 Tax=Anguilla anguilla TaxID=7936 RepID=A0A0E9RUF0_ANGAN